MNLRIIPRLDIKGPNLVKGINLEGLRIIGDPQEYAEKYYLDGADEIIYIDSVASLYGRNNLREVVDKAARKISIPLTVGGGLRTIEDIKLILKSGADKVAINTEAVSNPEFIKRCVNYFGSSTIVLSINYKAWPNDSFKKSTNLTVGSSSEKDVKKWKNYFQVYTENGRQQTGFDAFEWAQLGEKYGVGEILLTSIDNEGMQKGFEMELTERLSKKLSIPFIICGGLGKKEDAKEIYEKTKCNAISFASVLHYEKLNINEIKNYLSTQNIKIIHHEQ
jgi:cyclase